MNEVSRLFPRDRELSELATQARLKTQRLVAKAIAVVKDPKQGSLPALLQSAYAALIYRDDRKLVDECVQTLRRQASSPESDPSAKLILAILEPRSRKSESSLVELAKAGVAGQDLVVLLAWGCRQTGGEAPSAFREHATKWLSSQPLPGDVIVLVNRP